MTTVNHNVGDEFIREGIRSFLDEVLGDYDPYYVHKHDLATLHKPLLDETELLADKFRDADLIIQAGSPVYWAFDQYRCYTVDLGPGVVGTADSGAWSGQAGFEYRGGLMPEEGRRGSVAAAGRSAVRRVCPSPRRRVPLDQRSRSAGVEIPPTDRRGTRAAGMSGTARRPAIYVRHGPGHARWWR